VYYATLLGIIKRFGIPVMIC